MFRSSDDERSGAGGQTSGGDRASGCPLGRLEGDQTRRTSVMGGEWNELGADACCSFKQRLASPWRNAAGATLTAGTACRSMRTAVARSARPCMQQGGGAVVHPLLQQSCAANGPAGLPGMKQSPRVPDPARATATTSTRQRRGPQTSAIPSITPLERPRVKARAPGGPRSTNRPMSLSPVIHVDVAGEEVFTSTSPRRVRSFPPLARIAHVDGKRARRHKRRIRREG